MPTEPITPTDTALIAERTGRLNEILGAMPGTEENAQRLHIVAEELVELIDLLLNRNE